MHKNNALCIKDQTKILLGGACEVHSPVMCENKILMRIFYMPDGVMTKDPSSDFSLAMVFKEMP